MTSRLNHLPTLKIDAAKKIPFTYKNKTCYGVEGDTVASALFANGVRVFGRSLKYHRPRGALQSGWRMQQHHDDG